MHRILLKDSKVGTTLPVDIIDSGREKVKLAGVSPSGLHFSKLLKKYQTPKLFEVFLLNSVSIKSLAPLVFSEA